MALTLWQRMRVGFRGWLRRREEDARKKEADFLARNVGWGKRLVAPVVTKGAGEDTGAPPASVDMDGLQVAYLDESGMIAYYLDTSTGEVVESRDGRDFASARYQRVPQRSVESDAEDRRAFAVAVEDANMRQALSAAIEPHDFRRVLAKDRGVERAWYNFKNDRAVKAIDTWLRRIRAR